MDILTEKKKQLKCYEIEKNVINKIKYDLEIEKSNREAVIETLEFQNKAFYKTIEKMKESRKSIISCTVIYNLLLLISSFIGIANPSFDNINYMLMTIPSFTLLYLFVIYKDCSYLKNNNGSYIYKLIHKNKKNIHNLKREIKSLAFELENINNRIFECNQNIDKNLYDINLYTNNKNNKIDTSKEKKKILK